MSLFAELATGLLDGEVQVIQNYLVWLLVPVSVDLIIDGHTVPTGRSWRVIAIDVRSVPVQRDRLKQQVIIAGSLGLQNQVVPGITDRVARNSAGNPMLSHIVPSIPFVAAGDSAFMSPDERLPPEELVNVEFQSL
jgi:hypothetical protein